MQDCQSCCHAYKLLEPIELSCYFSWCSHAANIDSFWNVLMWYAHIVWDIITVINKHDPMQNPGQTRIFYNTGQTRLTWKTWMTQPGFILATHVTLVGHRGSWSDLRFSPPNLCPPLVPLFQLWFWRVGNIPSRPVYI